MKNILVKQVLKVTKNPIHVLLAVCLVCTTLVLFAVNNQLSFTYNYDIANKINNQLPVNTTTFIKPPKPLPQLSAHEFWNHLFKIYRQNRFDKSIQPLIQLTPSEQHVKSKVKSEQYLLSKAEIFHKDTIIANHASVFHQLPEKLPLSIYKPNSYGIVTIGGNFYSWLALVQLLGLRKLGSQLPVEVVIPTLDDYRKEAHFCEEVLPKYNAKCVLVPEVLGIEVAKYWNFKSYQYKALALAISSFENTLLLDSDNIPVMKPEKIFESSVYKDNGMILWPDYWERTMSPEWHNIVNKPYSTTKKIRQGRFPLINPITLTPETNNQTKFNDLEGTLPDLSTESGQVIINKKTHGKVVLLSLYYNIFGPEIYYKLFSLGAMGEGDKDTFAAAAYACDAGYYQVKSLIKTFGYHSDGFHGMAMGQKNPQVDYELYQKHAVEETESIDELKGIFQGENKVPMFAIHCNIQKLNPEKYMENDGISDREANRMKVRFYSNDDDESNESKEIDFELSRWQIMDDILCRQQIRFGFMKDCNLTKICGYVNNTIKWLSE
ncbi:MNN22 Alpha-1 [Candida maltosa Xu316]